MKRPHLLYNTAHGGDAIYMTGGNKAINLEEKQRTTEGVLGEELYVP